MVFNLLADVGVVIGCFVTALFVLSIVFKRNDIADIAWGIGILLVALVSHLHLDDPGVLNLALLIMAGLWGGRLSLRILLRNLKKNEDVRYRKWRNEWKWFYLRSFFQVYVLQGLLMVVVGYSFVHATAYGQNFSFGLLQYIGVTVWVVGYLFEVMGDWQLDHFLAQPKEARGAILRSGLWRYSRHPNYFGEVTMWWGIWLMIATLPLSLVALVSPLMITFLILKVSGIPMLEKSMEKIPEFAEYKKQTSVFFPLPPKQ